MFWRFERIFSIDNRFSGTKDFTLRQGGKRRKGRSILEYVTDFTNAANAASV
ncbi:hypothetical protein N898_17615 [Salmonella enterica subsp. arizonae serovar 62:z36:- str. RKS2983]|nr:hypothetical protein N898_17615 [Salmonella enterica subsp. arizonae serovar 62:z36:- str. RKS2983]